MRLSELVATLSLVADLGMGRPMERVLRQTVIAMRLAAAVDVDDDIRAATYYTSLITWVGCATDTSELAGLFGDETELYADTHDEDLAGVTMATFVARHLGRGTSSLRRVGMVGTFLVTAGRSVKQVMQSHCLAASEFAGRLDLGDEVRGPLLQAFERWDGRGIPGSVAANGLAPAARLVHLADYIEAFHRVGGVEAALEVAQQRRGTKFDPAFVDCFIEQHSQVLAGLDQINAWEQVISLDPHLDVSLDDNQLDRALEAFGDFADLKSPFRIGHSRGVASVAAAAAERVGLSDDEKSMLYRAALVHDVGTIGVPSGVWDERKPWSLAQQERARTHPYLTERVLTRTPALAVIARCASLHHERLDGTGYPHGLRGDAIPFSARILAASDVYHAIGEPRPHREAQPADAAARILREEARAGRLDGEAVNAVLAAMGQRVRRRTELPAGLTAREAQVLCLLARGLSNPQIAAALTVSRKTVSSHLEHIFTKLGVSTRTEAALFAMRHGLIGGVAGDA